MAGVPAASAFGFTPGGVGVALVPGASMLNAPGELLRVRADGVFGSPQTTGLGYLNGVRMALFGRGRVVIAGTRGTRAQIAFGSVGGTFGRPQTLARGTSQETTRVLALASNAAGTTAAIVMAGRRAGTLAADQWLVVRPAGGSAFRRVATLVKGLGGLHGPQAVTVNPAGDVLAAWDDGDSVRALVVRASGTVGRVQRLGVGADGSSRISVALDATRRAVVLWMALGVGEGYSAFGPGTVNVAYAKPGKPFGTTVTLEKGLPTGEGRGMVAPVSALLLRDRGQLAWTAYAGGRYVVRVADIGAAGTPTAARTISPQDTDAVLAGMAAGPRGGLVLSWFSGVAPWGASRLPQASNPGVYAAARSATATAFGPPEPVETVAKLPVDGVPFVVPPLLATDPVSAQSVLLWSLTIVPPGQETLHYAIRQPT